MSLCKQIQSWGSFSLLFIIVLIIEAPEKKRCLRKNGKVVIEFHRAEVYFSIFPSMRYTPSGKTLTKRAFGRAVGVGPFQKPLQTATMLTRPTKRTRRPLKLTSLPPVEWTTWLEFGNTRQKVNSNWNTSYLSIRWVSFQSICPRMPKVSLKPVCRRFFFQ